MGGLIDKQRLLEDARKLKSAITGRDKPFPVAEAFMDVIEKQPEKRTQERTETHACDCISRQAAIDAINRAVTKEAARWSVEELPSAQPNSKDLVEKIKNGITASDGNSEYFIGLRNGMRWCLSLIDDKEPIYESSAHPETAKRIVGKSRDGMTLWYQCDMCNEPVDVQDNYCRGCGRRLTDG